MTRGAFALSTHHRRPSRLTCLSAAVLAGSLFACRPDAERVRCLSPSSVGWVYTFTDTAAAGMFTVKTFARNGGFSQPLSASTMVLRYDSAAHYGADTVPYANTFISHNPAREVGGYLDFSVDYEIDFPRIGRRFRIRGLAETPSSQVVNRGNSCVNGFGCVLNDTPAFAPGGEQHLAGTPAILWLQ